MVEGINMMPIIIGTFAICEVLVQAQAHAETLNAQALRVASEIRRRDFLPKWSEVRDIGLFTYLKSALIGYGIGILPGAGGSMAAFVAYADAKRGSKKPQEYGDGSREGIAAAESANNSMCGGAFVPMLMFGIPGDPTTAVVLGVLVINGLQPGPRLLENQVDLIAPMFASLLVSALILIPLTLFLLGPLVRADRRHSARPALCLHRGGGAGGQLRCDFLGLPDGACGRVRSAGVLHA
ncbi:tripartite tricarboxylate transporter permease [Roseibium salinum]|nr:tripartite tricarboxylate transporter permease [Roseibium salinum]